MAIEVRCPGCQSLLRIADENIGRKARCPSCSQVFTAEADPNTGGSSGGDALGGGENANQGFGGGATPPGMPPVPGASSPQHDARLDSGASPFGAPLPDSNPGAGAFPNVEAQTNPYAPTFSDATAAAPSGPISAQTITLDDVFSKSWAIFKKHWAMICVVVLIVGAVNFACQMIQNIVVAVLNEAAGDAAVVVGSQFLLGVAFWVLQIWLQLGQVMFVLDVARGRQLSVNRLFAAGPYLLSGIVSMIVVSFAIGMMGLVMIGIPVGIGAAIAQSGEGAAVGFGIGLLIAIVPLVIAGIAVSQIQPLIVDRGVGPIEAIRLSVDITSGNRFTLFLIGVVLMAVWIGSFIVGLLALCVGVIPAMIGAGAFTSLVLVVAYLGMTGQPVVIPASPTDPSSPNFQNAMP